MMLRLPVLTCPTPPSCCCGCVPAHPSAVGLGEEERGEEEEWEEQKNTGECQYMTGMTITITIVNYQNPTTHFCYKCL